jgi:hypothetical protein
MIGTAWIEWPQKPSPTTRLQRHAQHCGQGRRCRVRATRKGPGGSRGACPERSRRVCRDRICVNLRESADHSPCVKARSTHPEQGLNQQINGDGRVAVLLRAYFVALRSSGFALRAGILDNLIRW